MSGEVYGPDGERLAPDPAPLSLKKGDPVAVDIRAGVHATVEEVHSTLAMVRLDSGEYRSFLLGDLVKIPDPAPLSFSDVRSGDKITVEGEDYSITGEAAAFDVVITLGAGLFDFRRDPEDGTWHDRHGLEVKLTAHVPAEPEWHRAKVIKADADYRDNSMKRIGGLFLASLHIPGEFLDRSGNELTRDAFTNVTIIVDEHGEVRA